MINPVDSEDSTGSTNCHKKRGCFIGERMQAINEFAHVHEPNEIGRDFVIGDLHGSRFAFERMLDGLNFDKTKDRMFSVGDLVDRGEDSLWCLGLLREPWFHAVLSNHEDMMFQSFHGPIQERLGWAYLWRNNGGWWANDLINDELNTDDAAELRDLQHLVKQLPYLITVKMKDGKRFHIIHAELFPPEGIKVTDAALEDPVQSAAILTTLDDREKDGLAVLWRRHVFYRTYFLPGADLSSPAGQHTLREVQRYFSNTTSLIFNDELSHIISGHTPCVKPMTIGGQTNIDTKAFKTLENEMNFAMSHEALTCVELGTWKFFQSTPSVFRTVEPFVFEP